MAGDPIDDFLARLAPMIRPVAERVIATVRSHTEFDACIKWRQLTFAIDGDFDHWICAVAANRRRVNLAFHFGSMLRDHTGAFEESDAKFVRKICFQSVGDVDDAAVGDLLTQAIDTLPRFRKRV